MKTKIIYFGNEQLAQGIKAKTPIFDALLAADYEIAALILPTANTRRPFEIAKKAEKLNIPVFYTKDTAELEQIIANAGADVAVLASYGKIIPESIINAFPCGIINIHPSLLPKYRGTTPIETALLNNDAETGVSVMRLAKKMDAGNIIAQAKVAITPETTKQSLYEELATLGAKLLVENLPAVLAQNTTETAQDDTEATFTSQLSKDLSLLQNTQKSALTLSREVIAYAGYPKSKTTLLGIPCTVTAAHVADQAATELDLLCADGKYLVIDQIIPENSKPQNAQAFLNGHKK